MKEDLIFHLVTEQDWNEFKNDSMYSPQSLEEEGFIHCSTGTEVEQSANRIFKGTANLLLLVINTSLVDSKIKYEKDPKLDKEFPHIYGPLNARSVVDKISLAPEPDGSFNISFISD